MYNHIRRMLALVLATVLFISAIPAMSASAACHDIGCAPDDG